MATAEAERGNSVATWVRAWWQLIVAGATLLVGWGMAWATLDARIDAVCAEREFIVPEIQRLSQDIAVLRNDVSWIRETIEGRHKRSDDR